MTPENFVYWLQGYFEIQDAYVNKPNTIRTEYLDEAQVQLIRDHLKLVLEKKTPIRLPYSFSPPTMTTGIDPVYYPNNWFPPQASC